MILLIPDVVLYFWLTIEHFEAVFFRDFYNTILHDILLFLICEFQHNEFFERNIFFDF